MEVRKIPKKTVTIIPPKDKYYVDKDKYQQKRVAAYCRVSTDSEEQLMSYKTQKKVYTDMILENKEWCLAGIYADEGISGTQVKNIRLIYSVLGSQIRLFGKRIQEFYSQGCQECHIKIAKIIWVWHS